jgi:hypothetical protein
MCFRKLRAFLIHSPRFYWFLVFGSCPLQIDWYHNLMTVHIQDIALNNVEILIFRMPDLRETLFGSGPG